MNDSPKHQPKPKDVASVCAIQAGPQKLLDACVVNAEELLRVLEKEKEVLRRFDPYELLGVLPQKERLVSELKEKLNALGGLKSERGRVRDTSGYELLKSRMAEIKRFNDGNRIFIEGSLKYNQDILECLCPSAYGPRQEPSIRHDLGSFKGLTFRKEI